MHGTMSGLQGECEGWLLEWIHKIFKILYIISIHEYPKNVILFRSHFTHTLRLWLSCGGRIVLGGQNQNQEQHNGNGDKEERHPKSL